MAKKKIILFCAAGMSTSLLVTKMQEVAKKAGLDYEIHAYSMALAEEKGSDADAILIGPQVRFAINQLKKKLPDRKIEAINMEAYGLMDGAVVLKQAQRMMKE